MENNVSGGAAIEAGGRSWTKVLAQYRQPLRLVDLDGDASADTDGEVEALPAFLAGDGDDEEAAAEDEETRQHLVAAE